MTLDIEPSHLRKDVDLMIFGIGHDIVEMSRIRRILASPVGAKFISRILTPSETDLLPPSKERLAERVAGRFAAKEAVSKAFGCGIGQYLRFQDMEILPDRLGKPECRISAVSIDRLALGFSPIIHISLSHEAQLASAYAVVEKAISK